MIEKLKTMGSDTGEQTRHRTSSNKKDEHTFKSGEDKENENCPKEHIDAVKR